MKSGIRSIGLNAYATTPATKSFAYHGVWGCRAARYSAYTSRLSWRTRSLKVGFMEYRSGRIPVVSRHVVRPPRPLHAHPRHVRPHRLIDHRRVRHDAAST